MEEWALILEAHASNPQIDAMGGVPGNRETFLLMSRPNPARTSCYGEWGEIEQNIAGNVICRLANYGQL